MSCDENCSCEVDYLTIIQGEDRVLALRVKRANGASFDLTGVTEITARFLKTDATTLEIKLSDVGAPIVVTDAPAGRFTVSITDAQSALINRKSEPVDFTVIFDFGTTRRIVNYVKGLLVKKPSIA